MYKLGVFIRRQNYVKILANSLVLDSSNVEKYWKDVEINFQNLPCCCQCNLKVRKRVFNLL